MAITQSNKGSLLEQASKVIDSAQLENKSPNTIKSSDGSPKSGFLATTMQELKLVEWPSFGYVVKWSLVIIVFTLVLSLFIYNIDRVFKGGLEFFNCHSGNETAKNCLKEYGQSLVNKN
jgi:preprotein translocase SecE subunit